MEKSVLFTLVLLGMVIIILLLHVVLFVLVINAINARVSSLRRTGLVKNYGVQEDPKKPQERKEALQNNADISDSKRLEDRER